ncbi:DUF4870 family protein [Mesorhizobium sp. A623]
MSDTNNEPIGSRQDGGWFAPGRTNAQLVYILYLAGFVVGISSLIGLVFAYVNRGKSEAWVDTHYTFLIRTFWIGLLYGLASCLLMLVAIGFVLVFVTVVWVIARCIIGLQAVSRGAPIANANSWLLGR